MQRPKANQPYHLHDHKRDLDDFKWSIPNRSGEFREVSNAKVILCMLFAYITQDTSLLRIHPLFAAHLTSRERRRVYRLHAAHTHTAIINSRFNARPLFVSKHVAGSIDQILTQPVTNEINCNNIILDLALRRLPETHFQELLSASPIAACCDLLSSHSSTSKTHTERDQLKQWRIIKMITSLRVCDLEYQFIMKAINKTLM